MSFLRTAVARPAINASRRYYSTANTKSSSNIWVYSLGIAAVGTGAYYMYTKASPEQRVPLKSALDPKNFIDFELKKVEPYNHNTSKFTFKLKDDEASLLPVAACVIIKSSDPEALKSKNGKPIIRPYTPISPSDAPGELTFMIKRYESGNASKHIHSLKLGDKLAIQGPIPKFPYKHNEFEEVGMIAGGSGITPMYQLLTHALSNPENKTKFKLLFANVSEQDILLREEFDALKKKHPGTFDVVYTVDKAGPNWKGPTGYITKDLLKQHLASAALGEKVKVLVCGPPGQMKAISGAKASIAEQGPIEGILKELGYNESQVYKF